MCHYELDITDQGAEPKRVLVRHRDNQPKQPARFSLFAAAFTAALIIRELRIDTAFSYVTIIEVNDETKETFQLKSIL